MSLIIIIFAYMTRSDDYKEFGENFAIIAGFDLNSYKCELTNFTINENNVLFYILLECNNKTPKDMHNICFKLINDINIEYNKELKNYGKIEDFFVFNGLINSDDGNICFILSVSMFALNDYKFNENIICSVKTINKFNL